MCWVIDIWLSKIIPKLHAEGFDHDIANFEFDGWEFFESLGGPSNEKLSFIVIEF